MSFTQESWARDLLTRMGYPVTENNMTSVLAWQYQEGGHFNNDATFNPLNSTLGHKTYGSMNSVGVSTYPDYETGMAQTIKTLNLGYYDKIRADLQAGADPATTTADIKASPWGTWHGGASTKGALGQARKYVAAHPVGAVPTVPPTPAPHPAPAPAATHPAPAAPAPVTTPAQAPATTTAAAPAVVPAPTAGAPAAGSAGGSFTGADVDGLDRLAQDFTAAAHVVDMVKSACEAIVAAASMFGPFAAAFIAYLKGTVIPWLQRISEALQAMSKVLSIHSQAQKDASSSATSLPSYSSSTPMPSTSTTDHPSLPSAVTTAVAGAALALGGVGAAVVALPPLLAAAASTAASTATVKPMADAPERLVPHDVETGSSSGGFPDRETLDAMAGKEGGAVHPTATLSQIDGDVAVAQWKGDHYDVSLLNAQGGAATYAQASPGHGYSLGAVASGSANLVDAKVGAQVDLGHGLGVGLSNQATIGAEGRAEVVAHVSPGTIGANAALGGFVGAQDKVVLVTTVPYVTNTTELVGRLGAGGVVGGGIELGAGHLTIHGGLGAAVGLGGSVANSVDVDLGRLGTDVYTGAGTLATEVWQGIEGGIEGR